MDVTLRQSRNCDFIKNKRFPQSNSPDPTTKPSLVDNYSSELEMATDKSKHSLTSLENGSLDVGHVKKKMTTKGIEVNFILFLYIWS